MSNKIKSTRINPHVKQRIRQRKEKLVSSDQYANKIGINMQNALANLGRNAQQTFDNETKQHFETASNMATIADILENELGITDLAKDSNGLIVMSIDNLYSDSTTQKIETAKRDYLHTAFTNATQKLYSDLDEQLKSIDADILAKTQQFQQMSTDLNTALNNTAPTTAPTN